MIQYCVAALERDLAILCRLCLILNHLGGSLRASREAVIRFFAPLGKEVPFPAGRASRLTASRLAEPGNITLTEY